MDLIIKNGKLVSAYGVFEADTGVEGGKIVSISKSLDTQAGRVIDAAGKLVLPGLIDGHTHMEMPFMGTTTADDFESGTAAAACGGVTTIVDFVVQAKGQSLLEAADAWRKKADPKVAVDYALHLIIRDLNPSVLSEIGKAVSYGVAGFKLFMTYKKESLYLDDGSIFTVMKEAVKHGALVGLHCENADLIEHHNAEFLAEGKTSAEYHAYSRPPMVEAEAVHRGIALATLAGANMYVVHMSTALACDIVKAAMDRGLPVFAETCPHYLTFTDEMYLKPNGRNYIMSPPLRKEDDKQKLWQGLQEGFVQTVASDHACFNTQQKDMGKDDYTKVPNGTAGTEIILPILYSEGVRKGILSLDRLVRVTAYNPAKAFGLFPRKGQIAVGSDADLVVLDPQKKVKLTRDNLHSKLDHSIYEDITVTGYPVITVARGEIVHEDGKFTGKKGGGVFVKREPYPTKRLEL
ncbi:MAG: dihydropyrimidinase [Candidatus Bathyarchaeia archaeon]